MGGSSADLASAIHRSAGVGLKMRYSLTCEDVALQSTSREGVSVKGCNGSGLEG